MEALEPHLLDSCPSLLTYFVFPHNFLVFVFCHSVVKIKEDVYDVIGRVVACCMSLENISHCALAGVAQ